MAKKKISKKAKNNKKRAKSNTRKQGTKFDIKTPSRASSTGKAVTARGNKRASKAIKLVSGRKFSAKPFLNKKKSVKKYKTKKSSRKLKVFSPVLEKEIKIQKNAVLLSKAVELTNPKTQLASDKMRDVFSDVEFNGVGRYQLRFIYRKSDGQEVGTQIKRSEVLRSKKEFDEYIEKARFSAETSLQHYMAQGKITFKGVELEKVNLK